MLSFGNGLDRIFNSHCSLGVVCVDGRLYRFTVRFYIDGKGIVKEGSRVFHKEYGEGVVTTIVSDKMYVDFNGGQKRIFDYPDAFEKGWLS